MGVINTGEGLQYHPASLSRVQPNPEMVLRQSPLILNKIPLERACSSAVWYLLFRQIMHPDPDNGSSNAQLSFGSRGVHQMQLTKRNVPVAEALMPCTGCSCPFLIRSLSAPTTPRAPGTSRCRQPAIGPSRWPWSAPCASCWCCPAWKNQMPAGGAASTCASQQETCQNQARHTRTYQAIARQSEAEHATCRSHDTLQKPAHGSALGVSKARRWWSAWRRR